MSTNIPAFYMGVITYPWPYFDGGLLKKKKEKKNPSESSTTAEELQAVLQLFWKIQMATQKPM